MEEAARRFRRNTGETDAMRQYEIITRPVGGAVERRPISRTTSLNGETLLEESFAYATNALGGAIILRQRATVGGTPRVSYEEYDACSRLTLTVREDGRATRIAYGEWGDGGDAGEGGEDGRRGRRR